MQNALISLFNTEITVITLVYDDHKLDSSHRKLFYLNKIAHTKER